MHGDIDNFIDYYVEFHSNSQNPTLNSCDTGYYGNKTKVNKKEPDYAKLQILLLWSPVDIIKKKISAPRNIVLLLRLPI